MDGSRSGTSDIAELYAAIDAIADELEALARPAEQARRAPDELGALMKKARLSMAKVPREIGGCELSPAQQVDFFARLAYLNPSAGWLAFNQNGAAGMFGAMLSDAGVAKVFADDAPLAAGVAAPTGHSTRVDGGYRVTGKWSYASGADIADWIGLSTLCDEPAGPRFVVLDRSQVELSDNWHVAALQGTGSVDVIVDDAFVEEDLSMVPLQQRRGGRQYVHLGMRGYVAGENFGFSLGVAQRLIDEITSLARTKKRVLDPSTVGERGAFQQELGRTDTTVRAARSHMMSELDRATQIVDETDEMLPEDDRKRLEAGLSWATEAVVQAAVRLFPYAGAGALHLDSPIQMTLRDLIGSGQHLFATNEALDFWGSALLDAAGPAA